MTYCFSYIIAKCRLWLVCLRYAVRRPSPLYTACNQTCSVMIHYSFKSQRMFSRIDFFQRFVLDIWWIFRVFFDCRPVSTNVSFERFHLSEHEIGIDSVKLIITLNIAKYKPKPVHQCVYPTNFETCNWTINPQSKHGFEAYTGSHKLFYQRLWRNISCYAGHDDVIKWKYFPRYWPFVRGIHRFTVNSIHKGQ